jgi:hypothetical protein
VGDAKAGSKTARAGAKRSAVRRRAVGTRDRVVAYLASAGEIADPTGMASTRLAEAVGYPGSSVAFAQLLSGMERDGLIVREVRGKRTYRITLPEGASAQAAARSANPAAQAEPGPGDTTAAAPAAAARPGGPPAGEFDYDELARRLLIQVVRRLAASSADELGATDALGALSAPVPPEPAGHTALEQTVAGLERELATAWTRHGTLTAENAKLREQLWEAQRSLDRARERERDRPPITDELNRAEVVLLERLLSPSRDGGDQRPGATAS